MIQFCAGKKQILWLCLHMHRKNLYTKFSALRLSLECGIVWRMMRRGFHVYFIYYASVRWHSELFNYGILSYFLMRMHSCITWVIFFKIKRVKVRMDLKAFPVPSHWEMRKCGWMRQEIEEVRVRQSEIFLSTLAPYIFLKVNDTSSQKII